MNGRPESSIYDPIGNILRLIMINYMPEGTKIHITRNGISYDQPYPYPIQGLMRFIYGSSANDIGELKNVISIFHLWRDDIEDYNVLKPIIINAIDRLVQLYEDRDIIIAALTHYKSILNSTSSSSCSIYNQIYDDLKKLWLEDNKETYKLMINYIRIMNESKNRGENIDPLYLDGATNIVESMGTKSYNIIKNIGNLKI